MSISSRIERVRQEDLLDDRAGRDAGPRVTLPPAPARRARPRRRRAPAAHPADRRHAQLVSLETIVLVYLLVVVAVAMVGGVIAAVLGAVAAALLINFFFVAPVHTLDVARGEQALALAVFVIVAAVVSGPSSSRPVARVRRSGRRPRPRPSCRWQGPTSAAGDAARHPGRRAARSTWSPSP